MSALILPPRLNGNTRATIELRIEAILLTNFSAKQRIKKSSVKVFVRWWGQAISDGIYFSPRVVQSLGTRRDSSPASKGIRVAIYKVSQCLRMLNMILQELQFNNNIYLVHFFNVVITSTCKHI